MKIEEREKDLRTQDIIKKFINEFYNLLNDKKSIFKPYIECLDYGRTNTEFNVRGVENYNTRNDILAKKSGVKENKRVIPLNMSISLHVFMRQNIPNYQPGDNFPKIIIDFKENSRYGYDHVTKTFYIWFGEHHRKNFRKYLDSYLNSALNPIEVFYLFLSDKLFNGKEPSKMLIHEISHMVDDYMEFEITNRGAFDYKEMENASEEEKRKILYAYYNDPEETEAYLREEIYSYYDSSNGIFQYIAQRMVNGSDVNFLISDIIKDILENFKTRQDRWGYTSWELWSEKNRKRIVKRLYSAIETLLSHEVDKIGSN